MHDAITTSNKLLTPETSVQDPRVFKESLINNLDNYPLALAEWKLVQERFGISVSDIKINSNTWVSNSESGNEINLGTQPMPKHLISRLIFHGETFTYQEEMSYRFIHEMTHKFVSSGKNADVIETLYKSLQQIRQLDQNKGMSALGSYEFYRDQGIETQAKEDMVELMTMYLFNPEYFHQYMNFVSQEDSKGTISNLGLLPISKISAENTELIIKQIVDRQFK